MVVTVVMLMMMMMITVVMLMIILLMLLFFFFTIIIFRLIFGQGQMNVTLKGLSGGLKELVGPILGPSPGTRHGSRGRWQRSSSNW